MYPASVADVVKRHAQGNHSTLQQYSPDPDAAVPYYRMGVRGLGSQVEPGKKYMEGRFHFSTYMLTTCTLWATKAAILA